VVANVAIVAVIYAFARTPPQPSDNLHFPHPRLCSGVGYSFPDTGYAVCECLPCFTGENCETPMNPATCSLLVGPGQPYLMEYYWAQHEDIPGTIIPIDYRVPYQSNVWTDLDNPKGGILGQLAIRIKAFHQKYGNAETSGYSVVFGTGARQLTAAAIYALSSSSGAYPIQVYVTPPYYNGYSGPLTELKFAQWNQSTNMNPNEVAEIVTIPNNPDGNSRTPTYTSAGIIYDLVYYWPHLNPTPLEKRSEDIMLFSWTKCTGHAASRFGWALVKDSSIARIMGSYISTTTIEPCIEAQYRALGILDYLIGPQGAQFFDYTRTNIISYWNELVNLFQGSTTFTIMSQRNSAYAWIRCSGLTENQCNSAFTSQGISGSAGRSFGLSGYYRINLTIHPKMFDVLITKLKLVLGK